MTSQLTLEVVSESSGLGALLDTSGDPVLDTDGDPITIVWPTGDVELSFADGASVTITFCEEE